VRFRTWQTIFMKRFGRLVWIVVVNALVAWAMFVRMRSSGFPPRLDFQSCFEFAFEVFLPTVGIVFEILNWRIARWINVGSFVIAGCFWLIAAIWDHSDPFFGVLLITAIGLFVIAGLNKLAYRLTKSDPYDANSR
jgi:hypothetical protein